MILLSRNLQFSARGLAPPSFSSGTVKCSICCLTVSRVASTDVIIRPSGTADRQGETKIDLYAAVSVALTTAEFRNFYCIIALGLIASFSNLTHYVLPHSLHTYLGVYTVTWFIQFQSNDCVAWCLDAITCVLYSTYLRWKKRGLSTFKMHLIFLVRGCRG